LLWINPWTKGFCQNDLLAEELDVFIEAQIEAQNFPGLAASIVKEGQVVWSAAYGLAHVEEERPVTLETNFTLASISKLFTATACAKLSESGALDLDANINDYLSLDIVNPNFPNQVITTRQLLQHKSSLRDSESDLQLWDAPGDPIYDLNTFCSEYFIPNGSLYEAGNWGNNAPGAASYWYSNAGYTLLGLIVEEVSAMPFNEYCASKILEPLQMTNAGWFYSEVDSASIAMPYNNNGQAFGYFSVPEYPAAMLKANITELSNFLIAYTQGGRFGEIELFNQETFAELVPEDMTNGFGWWGTDTWWGDPNGNFWSHGGFMNGVRTQLNYYPESETGLIILTNGEGNYNAIQNKLEEYIPLFEASAASGIGGSNEIELSIFPNPANKELYISLPGFNLENGITLNVFDSQGKLVKEIEPNSSSLYLDLSIFAQGLYYLEVGQGKIRSSLKFLVR